MNTPKNESLFFFFWQLYVNKEMPDLGKSFANMQICYIYIKYWKKILKKEKSCFEKEAYIYSNECGQDWGCSSDLLTVWRCDVHCLLTAGGWGPSPDWLSSRMSKHPRLQTLPLWNANTHVLSIKTDTTGHFCMHIWPSKERTAGAISAGSIFSWVSVYGSAATWWTISTALWNFW